MLKAVWEGGDARIDWDRLARGMAREAWWPRKVFLLSFGDADQIDKAIDRMTAPAIGGGGRLPFERSRRAGPGPLRADGALERREGILFYVPTRLLSPWFDDLVQRGRAVGFWERRVEGLSAERFASAAPPLYMLDEGGILPHPGWVDYLRMHAGVVEAWADWHWYSWLQARNPNVPMVGRKLGGPPVRTRPGAVREHWAAYVAEAADTCIYSGAPLAAGGIALDHFVPHNFVEHDQV